EDNSDRLSDIEGQGMMLTARAAAILYPGKDPFRACDSLVANYEAPANPYMIFSPLIPKKLLALVGEFRPMSTELNSFGGRFDTAAPGASANRIVMRLHENVDRDKFVTQLLGRIDEFRRGNVRAVLVRSHREIITINQNRETGPERRLDRLFAVFFLFNVCLGVTGTFWMMTRKRASEVGVFRAFGATPGRVRRLLLNEATMLAVGSWLIGCGLYFIYAWHNGLYLGISDDFSQAWVESFPLHFAVISGIILILLFLSVAVGVAGPGWRLSRINPVDALRSE
ncbi:MAG: ABC transporter permease, partial [Muribaculaceae bacterium]|nr:ABC transporter permease [Muribaculaceae bacterium]